jgi:hypothetical protein
MRQPARPRWSSLSLGQGILSAAGLRPGTGDCAWHPNPGASEPTTATLTPADDFRNWTERTVAAVSLRLRELQMERIYAGSIETVGWLESGARRERIDAVVALLALATGRCRAR